VFVHINRGSPTNDSRRGAPFAMQGGSSAAAGTCIADFDFLATLGKGQSTYGTIYLVRCRQPSV